MFKTIRERQQKCAEYNRQRRMKNYKPADFAVGDYVLVYAPARVEHLPNHLPRTQKMLDRFLGPFKITSIMGTESSKKYVVYNVRKSREEVYRGETLSLYCPWRDDGTPSIPARKYLTLRQRKTINAQKSQKYVPPEMRVGDLIVFPRVMADGSDGFGVGKVAYKLTEEAYNCQWYSNDDEELTGTYAPCWLQPDGSWYAAPTRKSRRDKPLMTDETYGWPITRDIIADSGFRLSAGRKLPEAVLDRIRDHRSFHWGCQTARRKEKDRR